MAGNLGLLMENHQNMLYSNGQTPPRTYLNQAEEDVDDHVDPINTQFNGLEVKSIKSNTHSQHVYPAQSPAHSYTPGSYHEPDYPQQTRYPMQSKP